MGKFFEVFIDVVILVALVAAFLWAAPIFLPGSPGPGPQFDCDDSALLTYHHFTRLGFECRPIAGNLNMTGETYQQCNHVWLWVKIKGRTVPYDWGIPRYDEQHFEGYLITYEKLLEATRADLTP